MEHGNVPVVSGASESFFLKRKFLYCSLTILQNHAGSLSYPGKLPLIAAISDVSKT